MSEYHFAPGKFVQIQQYIYLNDLIDIFSSISSLKNLAKFKLLQLCLYC